MTALIIGLAVTAHVTCALTVARVAYGRFRVWWRVGHPPGSYNIWTVDGRCIEAAIGLTVACVVGLWPLVLAVGVVTVNPPKTPGEVEAELKRQAKRVTELERELGIKP